MEIPRQRNIQTSEYHSVIFLCTTELEHSTRVQQIQADMTYRALELLNLPEDEPAFLLDIGCGSGLSGEILDEEGYNWVGVDVAPSMLGTLTTCQHGL